MSKNLSFQGNKKQNFYGYLFLLPSLAGVSYFVLIPFLDVIRRSFFDPMGRSFTGITNYKQVFHTEVFLLAGGNTFRFMAVCIPLLLLLSLLLALAFMQIKKKADIWKTMFLTPLAVPAASMVVLWKLFFHENGYGNSLLMAAGYPSCDFMNHSTAFYILLFCYLWKNIGYTMILWIAGLSGIPKELYEASSIDGAGRRMQFFKITLPSLIPTIITTIILSVINSFKIFREAYLIAGNYPHESMFMLQQLFNNWFLSLDIQKLCTGAVILAVVIVALTACLQLAGDYYEKSME